jgi:hypothetical protein
VAYGDGPNTYSYVRSRPLADADPLGQRGQATAPPAHITVPRPKQVGVNPPVFGPPLPPGYQPPIPPVEVGVPIGIDIDHRWPSVDCIFESSGAEAERGLGYTPPQNGIFRPGISHPFELLGKCEEISKGKCDRITLGGHGIRDGCGIRAGDIDVFGTRKGKCSADFDSVGACLRDRLKPGGYIRICSCGTDHDADDPAEASACAQRIATLTESTVCYCKKHAYLGISYSWAPPNYCTCENDDWACVPPNRSGF